MIDSIMQMGWYSHVQNYTKGQRSVSQFKNGSAKLAEILKDNPEWSSSDVIVGGGPQGRCYFLITGWDKFQIINQWEDCEGIKFPSTYVIEPLSDTVTECSCGALLTGSGIVLAYKNRGHYEPELEGDGVHCSECHQIWDGYAQCSCL